MDFVTYDDLTGPDLDAARWGPALSDDKFQAADSPKYLMVATASFDLLPDRPARFAVDLSVENIGGEPGDYRRAMAAFHVFDLAVSQRVFAVCGTRPVVRVPLRL